MIVIDRKQQPPSPAEILVRIYKINEKDGPKIKSLINSIISATEGSMDMDRKLFIDKDDLIVRDTPENIKKIEELLLDKKFIQDMTKQKLDIANFSLVPREGAITTQTRAFAARAVDAIKVFLYSQTGGEAKAAEEGRHLWYDPYTLQLAVTDTSASLARVRQYLESLPELGKQTHQEVVTLKHQRAEIMAPLLDRVMRNTLEGRQEVYVELRQGEPKQWRDLTLRLTRVRVPNGGQTGRGGGANADSANRPQGGAEFDIDTRYKSQQRTMQVQTSEYIDNYRITLESVQPDSDVNPTRAGTARFHITYVPQAASTSPVPPPAPAPLSLENDGLTIQSFPERGDLLIIRYTNVKLYQDVQDLIAQLDRPAGDPIVRDMLRTLGVTTATAVRATSRPTVENLKTMGFSLMPRDTQTTTAQRLGFARRIVQAIKLFLYNKEPEQEANKKGRKLTFNEDKLELVITDTPANLVRIRNYLDSLPEMNAAPTHLEVVNLKYQSAKKLAPTLQKIIGLRTSNNLTEIVFQIRQGEEKKWRDLTFYLLRVRSPRPGGGAAEFTLDTGYQTHQLSMQEANSQYFDNYRITLEQVSVPSGDAMGRARFRVKYIPQKATVLNHAQLSEAAPLTLEDNGISITPSDQPNALIIRYKDSAPYRDVLDLIGQFDKPTDGPSVAPTPTPTSDATPTPSVSAAPANVIFLTYAVAEGAAADVMDRVAPPGTKYAMPVKIKSEGFRRSSGSVMQVGDLDLRAVRIEPANPAIGQRGLAELSLIIGKESARFQLSPGQSQTVLNRTFTADAVSTQTDAEGRNWISLRVPYVTKAPLHKPEAKLLPGVTVEPVGDVNCLIVHTRDPKDFAAVQEIVKALDHPTPQVSIETAFLQENTTATQAPGAAPFDPLRDLGATLKDARVMDAQGKPAPIQIPALGANWQSKIKALKTDGRLQIINGPRVTSLINQEAYFAIDFLPSGNPKQGFTLRLTPDLNDEKTTISLKNLAVEWVEDMGQSPVKNPPGRKVFDIELKDRQTVLLADPAFGRRWLLLTAYRIE